MKHRQLAIWPADFLLQDGFFSNEEDFRWGGCNDGCHEPNIALREELLRRGWETHTYDVYLKKNIVPDVVLFTENFPHKTIKQLLGDWYGKVTPYFLPCECEVISKDNWDVVKYHQFRRIFVWKDALADGDRYIWANYAPCLVFPPLERAWPKENFCVLLNSNKFSDHPLELYSERAKVIDWFEQYHHDDFDFYGRYWDRHIFRKMPWRIFNRIKWIGRLLAKKHICYRGLAKSKLEILKQYKFSICFENAKEIPSYFTEKLFDCFTAGCVPIYWGAPNVLDYIPKDCFIDYRNFKTLAQLYVFLKGMSDEKYLEYLDNIKNYIASSGANRFRKEVFAKTIADTIIADFDAEKGS